MGYAETYTPRYRVKYRAAGIEHTTFVRSSRGTSLSATISEGQTTLYTVFGSLATDLANDFAWLFAEVADKDSNVFQPAFTPTAVIGLSDWVAGNWSPRKRCSFLHMRGKGSGARCSMMIFGLNINGDSKGQLGADGVVSETEYPALVPARVALDNLARAANGTPALWYHNGFHKIHDRLLRDVRRGIIS